MFTNKEFMLRNERGRSLIEALIIILIILILAAIAIPAAMRARINAVTQRFENHFGVSIADHINTARGPSTEWLNPDQKTVLRPLVASRLQAVCVDPTSQLKDAQKALLAFLEEPAAMQPAEAATRLKRLAELTQGVALGQYIADSRSAECQGAQDAAKQLGLLQQ